MRPRKKKGDNGASSSSTSSRRKVPKTTSRRRKLRFQYDEEGNITESHVKVEPPAIPAPSEQEKKMYDALHKAFLLGDDAARAVARFERDVILPRYRENDESEEEFRKEEMESIMGHLGRIHMIRAMLPFYGLQEYEKQVVGHFINQVFNKGPMSNSRIPTVYRGDDESYLGYLTMTSNNDG